MKPPTPEGRRLMAFTLFVVVSAFWLIGASFGNDALVYRAGAANLIGGDPWHVTVNGYSYAAPPLEAIPFLPFVLLPDWLFRLVWELLCIASAVAIVRRLRISPIFLAYPPLMFGVILGNPSIPGMAALLMGLPLVGLVLRPQLLFVASPRAVLVFGILSLGAIMLRPDFLTSLSEVTARYAAESGRPVNFWGSWLMLPCALSLLLLARKNPHAAAWLVMPALAPAMGWYGYAMVLPVGSLWLALACAVPVPGLGAAAITLYALGGAHAVRDWRPRRAIDRMVLVDAQRAGAFDAPRRV